MKLWIGSCLSLFCAVLFDSPAAGEDWPQFRGQAGNATAASAQLPVQWGGSDGKPDQLLWKQALPGRGASSPIVWQDRIFLTCYTGIDSEAGDDADRSDLKLHVLCLERRTGNLVWDRAIDASSQTQKYTKRIQDHGYASSTPVTDGEAVYAFFGVSGVVAYDWNGKQLWQADVGDNTAGFGSASSPVVFEDLLIVNASIESDALIAFDKKTGQRVWKKEGMKRSWSTPCIASTADGTPELVFNQLNTIYGLNPRTGEQLWECAGIQDYVVPVPVAHKGIVYCLGGRQNRCIAVKLGGRGDVTDSHKLWEVTVGANVTSPVYYQGHLYWASDKAIANCLNAETGEAVYRERLKTRARIYASIVRAGEYLLVTTRDQGIVVLPARPVYEELAINRVGEQEEMLNASPAVAGSQLLVRTDSYLYCFGAESP